LELLKVKDGVGAGHCMAIVRVGSDVTHPPRCVVV
jgi:hypothetical protein